MSRKQSELEGRLDDMLSRIAMETQEIKELEQQLTDGQILANESLQKDLEGIISGLQEHLRGLREQASAAQQQLHSLQVENESLQRLLEDRQRHCRQLEDSLRTHRQMEVQQLTEELTRQITLGQMEVQQLTEELTRQITLGQEENHSLQQEVQRLQVHLDQTRIHLDQITASMVDPHEVQRGPEELDQDKYSPVCPEDMLSRSVEKLYRAIQQTRTSREQLQDQNHSQDQIARLQAQVVQDQNHITQLEAKLVQDQDYITQLEAKMVHSVDQDQVPDWRLKEELQKLRVRLKRSQTRNREKLLQDVQQERDELLQQLRSQTSGHQRSLNRLNRKLRQLSKSMCDSDQLTAKQLESSCEQLRALNSLVELLHQEDDTFHPPGGSEQTAKEAQRQELDQTRTKTRTRTRDGGRWGFLPPGHSAPSLVSLGPLDSGLGSPERGRQDGAAPGGGCDTETSRGHTPPPPPPPPPLVGPAWLLCAPPAGGAVLHRHTGDRCVCVNREVERLEEEKRKLRQETRELRRRNRVMEVCEEVECLEKTLLKRRAELRQADRVLLEAQSRCKASWAQQQEDIQHIRALQEEVEELRRRRQEEEQSLREVEEVLRSREQELQQLDVEILSASQRYK